jgi:NAD(P)H-hydrate repair Nnr-like enzyme with NAD(P)H-hydrate dehydratase domain
MRRTIHSEDPYTVLNTRKLGLAALAALLALPLGAGAVYAASSQYAAAGAVAQSHAAAPVANTKHDAETADDNEPKGGPDTDNVQEGPGNTAEGGPDNEAPGQEKTDKNLSN